MVCAPPAARLPRPTLGFLDTCAALGGPTLLLSKLIRKATATPAAVSKSGMPSTPYRLPRPRRSLFDDFASTILCQAHTGSLGATAQGDEEAATFGEGVTSLPCQTSSNLPRNASAIADVFSCPAPSLQGMAIGNRVVNSSASSFPPSGRMSFLSTRTKGGWD